MSSNVTIAGVLVIRSKLFYTGKNGKIFVIEGRVTTAELGLQPTSLQVVSTA